MPGMRWLKIVTIRFRAPTMLEIPTSARPITHRSMPVPCRNCESDSGAYPVQPPSAGPPATRKPLHTISTPNRYSQYDIAFSRGKATSAAPICNGTK